MAAKKIISLFLALALALTMLAGAALAENSADEHTIEFVDYDLFIQNQNANTLLDMLTLDSFNKAGEPALFQRNKSFSFDRYGDIKTLRLGD